MAKATPEGSATEDPASRPDGVRVIKRYANRKLYDTEAGRLTSLHEIEHLIRAGSEIRVVDHSTGSDITGELLVSILGSALEHRSDDVGALHSFIRSPGLVLDAVADDDEMADQLRVMGDRVRLLSATLDSLLENATSDSTTDPGATVSPLEGPPGNGAGSSS